MSTQLVLGDNNIVLTSSKSMNVNIYRYQSEIKSMLFTFGNNRNALPETTKLVEDIVRS